MGLPAILLASQGSHVRDLRAEISARPLKLSEFLILIPLLGYGDDNIREGYRQQLNFSSFQSTKQ